MSAAPGLPLDEAFPDGFRRRRGQNWVFLGLMYGFYYMARYNLSAISQHISEVFGWTNKEYGSVVSAGVLIYGLSVFLNGPLADLMGGKRALMLGAAGAATFNFLFGLTHLFVQTPAVVDHGKVLQPAIYADGMTASTVLATMMALWAGNHYFESFGALSIVKVNAAWFRVKERGTFAGIFGMMIQLGRALAFQASPLILKFLPWQYCFWVPAAIMAVMFFAVSVTVENTPSDAGYPDLDTGDGSADEQALKGRALFSFVLRKIFTQRTTFSTTVCRRASIGSPSSQYCRSSASA